MFTHVMLGSNDVARSKAFYDATLGALGIEGQDFGGRLFYMKDGLALGVVNPINGEPACFANGGTIGFRAASPQEVDAFHAAGLAHGGSDEGAPGPRENAPDNAYGAYLRDPDGNKICAFAMPAA